MIDNAHLTEIDEAIQRLRATALELQARAEGIPAVEKNTARVLASIRMLDLNISDVISLP